MVVRRVVDCFSVWIDVVWGFGWWCVLLRELCGWCCWLCWGVVSWLGVEWEGFVWLFLLVLLSGCWFGWWWFVWCCWNCWWFVLCFVGCVWLFSWRGMFCFVCGCVVYMRWYVWVGFRFVLICCFVWICSLFVLMVMIYIINVNSFMRVYLDVNYGECYWFIDDVWVDGDCLVLWGVTSGWVFCW